MNRWEALSGIGMVLVMFLPVVLVFVGAAKRKESEEKAREQRMAEHRMNARLLRLDI